MDHGLYRIILQQVESLFIKFALPRIHVEYKEIVIAIINLIHAVKGHFEFKHIKGHTQKTDSASVLNRKADKAAREGHCSPDIILHHCTGMITYPKRNHTLC
jgi:hypothetical protein